MPPIQSTVRMIIILVVTVLGVVATEATGSVLHESVKLLASEGMPFDELGVDVALAGDILVVGAPQPAADSQQPGKAYVFRRNGSIWEEEQILFSPDGDPKDEFGHYVAISGDVIVVGAALDDDQGTDSGAVYVYQFDATEACGQKWCQEQKIVASHITDLDHFGTVDVSGDVIIASSFKHNHGSPGAGAAFMFEYDATMAVCGDLWCEKEEILAFDGATSDAFGTSVAIDGDVAVVGSVAGNGNVVDSGAVYVYRRAGMVWEFEQKVFASDGANGEQFGRSVSVENGVLLVGAWLDDENDPQSGSAYVFRYDESLTVCGAKWCEEDKLVASDGLEGDIVGWSCDISGDFAVVGAPWHDHDVSQSGAAYVFRYDSSEALCGKKWCEILELRASDVGGSDVLGITVAVSGHTVVAGAPFDDDLGADTGSAYVFSLSEAVPAVSDWGIVVTALLLLAVGSLVHVRRCS